MSVADDTDREPYNYSPLKVGLALLSFGEYRLPAVGVHRSCMLGTDKSLDTGGGNVVGSILGGKYSDIMLRRLKKKNGGVGEPEMRLKSTTPGESPPTESVARAGTD